MMLYMTTTDHLALSASLNDLDFATLNMDGQSTEVEAPPDIIVVDDDDNFIDDEDIVPHDLVDSDDEVLANADDDDDEAAIVVYSNWPRLPRCVRPKRHHGRQGRRQRWRKEGVRKETRNLTLKKAVDEYGQLKIKFECNDKGTMLQIRLNAARWNNFVGELGSRSLVVLRDQQEEMVRLRDLGVDMPTAVPYTEGQIFAMARKGKQRGHIPGTGTYTNPEIDDMLASRDKMLTQLGLQREIGGGSGSGSGRGEDDQPGEDEDEDADGDDDARH
ncbi:hypothetical protein Tco_1042399 [Tanacetum coccineum]|uniref:Uncharacterized protein n=1 Tax=Tanacetum coccineum TaxID=301880 RepID=A0ABQ5GK35_9ASTR